jgi:Lipase (class 3)
LISHLDLARLAQSSYTDKPTWQVDERVRACLTKIEDTIIISVPGTDPTKIEDVLRDLDCDPVWVRGLGFCHDGFQDLANKLWSRIQNTVLGRERVIFTGHSLGGAGALGLAALYIRDRAGPAPTVVTFGAPKFGAQRFEWVLKDAEKHLYRFGNDPVPEVPGPWLFHLPPVWYAHPAPLTEIGAPKTNPISCHSIERYIEALDILKL